jgi:hypothetical protein
MAQSAGLIVLHFNLARTDKPARRSVPMFEAVFKNN